MNRVAAMLLALFAALSLGACEKTIGHYDFKLTIEVETPDGLRSASNVMHASYGFQPSMQGGDQAWAKFYGDAVFVDLGPGPDGKPKHLIALLAHGELAEGWDQMKWLPIAALLNSGWGYGANKALEKNGGVLTGSAELPPRLIPTLAIFNDLSDPTTAKIIKPDAVEQALGPGYRFRRAIVEMLPTVSSDFFGRPQNRAKVTRMIQEKMLALRDIEKWNAPLRALPYDAKRPRVGSGNLTRE